MRGPGGLSGSTPDRLHGWGSSSWRYMPETTPTRSAAPCRAVINIHRSFLLLQGRAPRAGPRCGVKHRRDRPLRDRDLDEGRSSSGHLRLPRRLHAGHGGARPGRGAPRRPGRRFHAGRRVLMNACTVVFSHADVGSLVSSTVRRSAECAPPARPWPTRGEL